MASILPKGKTQFFNLLGRPLVGGKVYFYLPDTETKKDTWQDEAMTIPNTNPVVLDARGEAVIWGEGSYRQVVKDALGITIWDQEITEFSKQVEDLETAFNAFVANLADPADVTHGDAMIAVKQAFDGAAARTQHDKNSDTIDIADIDGVVLDGETIIDGVLNAAFGVLSMLGGCTIRCRRGTGLLDNPLYIPSNIHLEADAGFLLRVVGHDTPQARNSAMFTKANGLGLTTGAVVLIGSNCSVRGLRVDGNGFNNYLLNGSTKVYQDGSDINATYRLGYAGIRIGNDTTTTTADTQVMQYNVKVIDCDVSYCGWGGILAYGEDQRKISGATQDPSDLIGIDGLVIERNKITYCNSNNLAIVGARNFSVLNNDVVSAAHSYIKMYRNVENGVVGFNRLRWDANRFKSWIDGQTDDYNREYWFANRSEMLPLGLDTGSGLYRNISVVGNVLNGAGKVFRGIICYGPMHDVTVVGNRVAGVVRPFLFSPAGGVQVTGNTFECTNYVYTSLNPGTNLAGYACGVENRSQTLGSAYTVSDFTFSSNVFKGTGVSLVRVTSISAWDTMALPLTMLFQANKFDFSGLTASGATAVAPIVVTGTPAASARFVFKGNSYWKTTLTTTDSYDDVFTTSPADLLLLTTDLLFKRTLTLASGVSAGADGTPRIVYDDQRGLAMLEGSVTGYTVGTTSSILASGLGTRFEPTDNTDFVVSNSAGKKATVRVTQAGGIYVSAADDSGQKVTLAGITWSTEYPTS
jgi:hypothetical protein